MFFDFQDRVHPFWKCVGKFLWRIISNEELQFITICLALAATAMILAIFFLPNVDSNWIQ